MVLGNSCTRNCRFCAVQNGTPEPVDSEEPARVAQAVQRLGLAHAVVTSVTRDDLPDGGAGHFAATVLAIRDANPGATVEVLVPDFNGDRTSIACVLASEPDVFGHNIETVARLYPGLRGAGHSYELALSVLYVARELAPQVVLKSALMLGHGETPDEVRETLGDVLATGCEAVCIGQYLQPTKLHSEVVEFVPPAQFLAHEQEAYRMGFKAVMAGPLVRSSYHSRQLLEGLRGGCLARQPAQRLKKSQGHHVVARRA